MLDVGKHCYIVHTPGDESPVSRNMPKTAWTLHRAPLLPLKTSAPPKNAHLSWAMFKRRKTTPKRETARDPCPHDVPSRGSPTPTGSCEGATSISAWEVKKLKPTCMTAARFGPRRCARVARKPPLWRLNLPPIVWLKQKGNENIYMDCWDWSFNYRNLQKCWPRQMWLRLKLRHAGSMLLRSNFRANESSRFIDLFQGSQLAGDLA